MKYKVGIVSLISLAIFISQSFAGIPAEIKLDGWQRAKEPIVFPRDKLTNHIDGAAEIYYTYAVKDVTVLEFEKKGGNSLSIDIYDMTTAEDAFGIYSFNRSGSKDFVEVGNEGIISPGLLDFWIDRYYARVSTGLDSKLSNADLIGVGKQIAAKIGVPKAYTPKLIKKLPAYGRLENSEVYFHQKLILDNVIPEINKVIDLKLNPQTNVIYSEHSWSNNTVKLLIVEYPKPEDLKLAYSTHKEVSSVRYAKQGTILAILLNLKDKIEDLVLLEELTTILAIEPILNGIMKKK